MRWTAHIPTTPVTSSVNAGEHHRILEVALAGRVGGESRRAGVDVGP